MNAKRRWEIGTVVVLLAFLASGGAWGLYVFSLSRPLARAIDNVLYDGADISTVRSLLNQGAWIGTHGRDGGTVLMAAAAAGDELLTRDLLRRGMAVDEFGEISGTTALHYAACYGRLGTLRLLLAHGADVNGNNCTNTSPLVMAAVTHRAGERELLPCVRELLAHGADPLHQDDDGDTAERGARTHGHPVLANFLHRLRRGARTGLSRRL